MVKGSAFDLSATDRLLCNRKSIKEIFSFIDIYQEQIYVYHPID